MADTTSTNGTNATPRQAGGYGANPPPGYPELRPDPVMPVMPQPVKPYIHNRGTVFYNPFSASTTKQTTAAYDPNDSASDIPETVDSQATAMAQDLELHEAPPPPAVPQPKSGPCCNPFSLLGKFFAAIWHFLGLIRNIIFTAFIIIILAVLAIFLITIYKPPVFWNPVKTFLNDGIDFSANAQVQSADIYNNINTTALAGQPVSLNNNELTQLFRDYNLLGDKCYVEAHPGGMRFYINIDVQERPLWLIVDTDVDHFQKFVITRVGFGRFNAPSGLTSIFNDTLGQVFQFLEKQVTSDSDVAAVKLFLNAGKTDRNLVLSKVEFGDGVVVLSYQNNSADNSNSGF